MGIGSLRNLKDNYKLMDFEIQVNTNEQFLIKKKRGCLQASVI